MNRYDDPKNIQKIEDAKRARTEAGVMSTQADVTLAQATLVQLEAIIDYGKQTFVEVGDALTEIRSRKLYREAGFATFESYCRKRHGFSASRGRQLIGAAATVTAVTLSGGTPPANEREARAVLSEHRYREALDVLHTEHRAKKEARRAENKALTAHFYSPEGLAAQSEESRRMSTSVLDGQAAARRLKGAIAEGTFVDLVARIERGAATRDEIFNAHWLLNDVARACVSRPRGDYGAVAARVIRKTFAKWRTEADSLPDGVA